MNICAGKVRWRTFVGLTGAAWGILLFTSAPAHAQANDAMIRANMDGSLSVTL